MLEPQMLLGMQGEQKKLGILLQIFMEILYQIIVEN
jgi:hypothetical protein